MLGLAEQVHSHNKGVGLSVGYDEDLCGAGHEVDAHLAEKLALGLGYESVPGPGQKVDPGDGLSPERQRGDGLYPTQDIDFVRPPICIAARVTSGNSPRIGGVQAATLPTSAALAVTMVMWADAVSA